MAVVVCAPALLLCMFAALPLRLQAQSVGGFTNPFAGAQPWTSEPVSVYAGLAPSYSVTKFSSVRLTGLTLNEHAASAMGIYLPVDQDGDGVVDLMDGRPIYLQRDARTVQPALVEVETGVVVGRYYLYYRYSLGGWAVHPALGSEQAMLFCSSDASMAHEIHGQRSWERVEGTKLQPDRRIQLLDLANHAGADAATGNFAPVDARLALLVESNAAAASAQSNLIPLGNLCPQGSFRDERTRKCHDCPRGRFGDSNSLTSAEQCVECPAGKFRGGVGGKTVLDCSNCTAGRYASQPGAEACGGECPLGKYSSVTGATDRTSCVKCPQGYRSEQCDRKDNSKQAKRAKEREKRERLRRVRDSARQAGGMGVSDCTA